MVGETVARTIRLGVIGDVHTEDALLERAIARLREARADVLVCVGDVVDGAGDVDRCFDLLAENGVLTVCGNHERWFLAGEMRTLPDATESVSPKTHAFLSALPRTLRFSTPAGAVLVGHAIGEDDMADLRPSTKGYALQAIPTLRELMLDPTVDFVIGGHTHERMARRFQGVTVLNAGSLVHDTQPCAMLVDFGDRRVTWLGLEGASNAVLETCELPMPAPLPESY